MEFNLKATPTLKMKYEEAPQLDTDYLRVLDNFKCEVHPQYRIDAFSMHKITNEINLHCIRCIIDGDVKTEEASLIVIKELFQNCFNNFLQKSNDNTQSQENMQAVLLSFLTKDYVGIYDKHLESQYEILDQKLVEMIELINMLREKYKESHRRELESLKEQNLEIKDKISKDFESNASDARPRYSSISDIKERLSHVTSKMELQNLLEELLYEKSNQNPQDLNGSDDSKRIMKIMDDIKSKVRQVENNQFETSHFEGKKFSCSFRPFVLICYK